jgi:hypothetical protein
LVLWFLNIVVLPESDPRLLLAGGGVGGSADPESPDAAAKGLEFRHVVLCGYLDDKPPADSMITRSLVYVGMTRATHELVLTASGKHPYLADLERF